MHAQESVYFLYFIISPESSITGATNPILGECLPEPVSSDNHFLLLLTFVIEYIYFIFPHTLHDHVICIIAFSERNQNYKVGSYKTVNTPYYCTGIFK